MRICNRFGWWCVGIALTASAVMASVSAATPEAGPSMNWLQALILGVVEGITEYLPVSSTGHLLVAQEWMGLRGNSTADSYAIAIQLGAILAVLWLYRQRIRQMLMGLRGRDAQGRHMVACIIAAFVPAAIIGLIGEKTIKKVLFGVEPITAAWIVGGIGILALDRWVARRPTRGADLESMTVRMALWIGLAQCVAMWPGDSRSLATIAAALLVGLSMPAAVEFSFLLGLITLGAATLLELVKDGAEMAAVLGADSMVIGLVTAFLSAIVAVKWMVAYLNRHGLAVFGWYRLALGVGVLAWLLWNQ